MNDLEYYRQQTIDRYSKSKTFKVVRKLVNVWGLTHPILKKSRGHQYFKHYMDKQNTTIAFDAKPIEPIKRSKQGVLIYSNHPTPQDTSTIGYIATKYLKDRQFNAISVDISSGLAPDYAHYILPIIFPKHKIQMIGNEHAKIYKYFMQKFYDRTNRVFTTEEIKQWNQDIITIAAQLLDQGQTVMIFPDGADKQYKIPKEKWYRGIAWIALKTQKPFHALPLYINNHISNNAGHLRMSIGNVIPFPQKTIHVRCGTPLKSTQFLSKARKTKDPSDTLRVILKKDFEKQFKAQET